MNPECLLAIKLQIARKTGILIRESEEGRLREARESAA
jgi:hypothetical protein